jgi:hypothetical protein
MTEKVEQEQLVITVIGKDTVALVNHLCAVTGMTAPCLMTLLVRKYGKDLVTWLGNPLLEETSPPPSEPKKLELPTDPGQHLTPIEL